MRSNDMVYPRLNFNLEAARAMPFFELCDRVWNAVVEASFASNFTTDECEYAESAFSNLLEQPWRIAYAVHAMEYDVLEGGFETFFANHGPVLNESVLTGLGLLGATEQQAIFRAAVENQGDEEELSSLTRRYYHASGDPRQLLAKYIITNFNRYCSPADSDHGA